MCGLQGMVCPLMDTNLITGQYFTHPEVLFRHMSQIFKYNIEHQLKHIVRDILSHEALRFLKFFNETKLVLQLQILCQVCLKL